MTDLLVYTDGSCPRNPGPGGWAFVVVEDTGYYYRAGAAHNQTNNTMEMTAVLEAMLHLIDAKQTHRGITILSDSQYTVKGITEWALTWRRNDWMRKNDARKWVPVKNAELWKAMLDARRQFESLRFKWVKGHAGNEFNELCDKLAGEAVWNLIENQ